MRYKTPIDIMAAAAGSIMVLLLAVVWTLGKKPQNPSSARLFGKREMVKVLREGNHVPIEFYGKVIDQLSNPVPDIAIEGSIIYNDGRSEGLKKVYVESDAKGEFHISSEKGRSLGVSFSSTNYLNASTNTYFIYSLLWPANERHSPDPTHPVVFHLWRRSASPEQLTRVKFSAWLTNQTEKIHIDLLENRLVRTNGDLTLTFSKRPPAGATNETFWYAEISVPDGGLMEVDDKRFAHTYQAPQDGWKKSIRFEPQLGDQGYIDYDNRTVFLKTRGGQLYAKCFITFAIGTSDRSASISCEGVANTNSSPLWEVQL